MIFFLSVIPEDAEDSVRMDARGEQTYIIVWSTSLRCLEKKNFLLGSSEHH